MFAWWKEPMYPSSCSDAPVSVFQFWSYLCWHKLMRAFVYCGRQRVEKWKKNWSFFGLNWNCFWKCFLFSRHNIQTKHMTLWQTKTDIFALIDNYVNSNGFARKEKRIKYCTPIITTLFFSVLGIWMLCFEWRSFFFMRFHVIVNLSRSLETFMFSCAIDMNGERLGIAERRFFALCVCFLLLG